MPSFKLKEFNLKSLQMLSKNTHFNAAVTVRPVITNDDFFRLNAYFLKVLVSFLYKVRIFECTFAATPGDVQQANF